MSAVAAAVRAVVLHRAVPSLVPARAEIDAFVDGIACSGLVEMVDSIPLIRAASKRPA